MSYADEPATVKVKFPDGTERDIQAHIEANESDPYHRPERGRVSSQLVPDDMPGYEFVQTVHGDWVAVRR